MSESSSANASEPIDPDLEPAPRPTPRLPIVLTAIAIGGIVGAEARYGLGLVWRPTVDGFPGGTFLINLSGSALIGVLMVVLLEVLSDPHPLVRPLLGVGVLGGYTTFSTYTTDALGLFRSGNPVAGFAYAVITPLGALAAVAMGVLLTRLVAARLGSNSSARRGAP